MAKPKHRIGKCIACGRVVEWDACAAGPVCYPCYWGAKLYYENGIKRVEDILPAFAPQLEMMFIKGGYSWPSDLAIALKNRYFDKCDTELRRWWSPRSLVELSGGG